MAKQITQVEYTGLQTAFDYFNKYLFDAKLPECLITFQNHPLARGFYRPKHFNGRVDRKLYTDEIALNPDWFFTRTNEEILSTLAHEMVHLWQYHFGKPSRDGYHNKEWARKMIEIGLQPVSNDDPKKIVGQSMTHSIIEKGRFQEIAQKLVKKYSLLNWESGNWQPVDDSDIDLLKLLINGSDGNIKTIPALKPPKKRDRSKVKFSCPNCEQNAWAKETAVLMCGICEVTMLENN